MITILFLGCNSNQEKKTYINGFPKIEGSYLDCKKDGWCNICTADGSILSKYQIIDYKGGKLYNQSIVYEVDGVINQSKSNFVKLNCSDTLFIGRNIINVKYCPLYKDTENNLFFCVGKKLNSDFSNINTIKIDTFTSPSSSYFIAVEFDKTGIDTIRGFVHEEAYRTFPNSKNIEYLTHKKLFEKVVYVKDTAQ